MLREGAEGGGVRLLTRARRIQPFPPDHSSLIELQCITVLCAIISAMSGLDINRIQELIRKRRVVWKRHALERMLERGLTRSIVLEAVLTGELIEDYTEDRPFPSGLFLGWQGKKPLHVVITMDTDDNVAAIVTAYEPNLEHFESDYRTRRKP